jgi:hypothetical protein
LRDSGFILNADKFFRVPKEYMTPDELVKWKFTLINMCALLRIAPQDRYQNMINSYPHSQYVVTKELLEKIYKDHITICSTKIKNFHRDGVLCDAMVDGAHTCVFLGRCRPRGGEQGIQYAAVGGYFSTAPMLLDDSRVEFPYFMIVGVGESLIITFWYGGECSMELRHSFEMNITDNASEKPNIVDISSSIKLDVPCNDDIEPHGNKKLCEMYVGHNMFF